MSVFTLPVLYRSSVVGVYMFYHNDDGGNDDIFRSGYMQVKTLSLTWYFFPRQIIMIHTDASDIIFYDGVKQIYIIPTYLNIYGIGMSEKGQSHWVYHFKLLKV